VLGDPFGGDEDFRVRVATGLDFGHGDVAPSTLISPF
jgi:hypothetical protein